MFNQAMLIGRIGKIEARTTQNGNNVVNLSVATERNIKNADGTFDTQTEWHNCVAFANQANYLVDGKFVNGQLIRVEGELRTREFEDKTQQKRRVTEIVVNRIQKLPSYWTKESTNSSASAPQSRQTPPPQEPEDQYAGSYRY